MRYLLFRFIIRPVTTAIYYFEQILGSIRDEIDSTFYFEWGRWFDENPNGPKCNRCGQVVVGSTYRFTGSTGSTYWCSEKCLKEEVNG